ncbi:MAG: transcriptional regulator [Alphaproteobacteria bacterium]
MTPDLLRRVGETCFGNIWQTDLARALGVADRTMRHWAAGTRPMPPGLRDDLARVVADRGRAIQALYRELVNG